MNPRKCLHDYNEQLDFINCSHLSICEGNTLFSNPYGMKFLCYRGNLVILQDTLITLGVQRRLDIEISNSEPYVDLSTQWKREKEQINLGIIKKYFDLDPNTKKDEHGVYHVRGIFCLKIFEKQERIWMFSEYVYSNCYITTEENYNSIDRTWKRAQFFVGEKHYHIDTIRKKLRGHLAYHSNKIIRFSISRERLVSTLAKQHAKNVILRSVWLKNGIRRWVDSLWRPPDGYFAQKSWKDAQGVLKEP